MISSTINNATVMIPDIPNNELNDDLSKALLKYQPKRKKKYKTIQELNPNPHLLSKKALKARKMKMQQKIMNQEKLKVNFDVNKPASIRKQKLGGRQLQVIKTSTLDSKFYSDSTANAIKLPPRKISTNPQPLRILGSRQKKVTETSKSEKTLPEKDSLKLADYIAKRLQKPTPKHSNTFEDQDFSTKRRISSISSGRLLSSKTPQHSRTKLTKHRSSNAELSLGSRQLDLVKIRPSKTKSKAKMKKKNSFKARGGRVRKVLKGRRKISSAELRIKASSFFQ